METQVVVLLWGDGDYFPAITNGSLVQWYNDIMNWASPFKNLFYQYSTPKQMFLGGQGGPGLSTLGPFNLTNVPNTSTPTPLQLKQTVGWW